MSNTLALYLALKNEHPAAAKLLIEVGADFEMTGLIAQSCTSQTA